MAFCLYVQHMLCTVIREIRFPALNIRVHSLLELRLGLLVGTGKFPSFIFIRNPPEFCRVVARQSSWLTPVLFLHLFSRGNCLSALNLPPIRYEAV